MFWEAQELLRLPEDTPLVGELAVLGIGDDNRRPSTESLEFDMNSLCRYAAERHGAHIGRQVEAWKRLLERAASEQGFELPVTLETLRDIDLPELSHEQVDEMISASEWLSERATWDERRRREGLPPIEYPEVGLEAIEAYDDPDRQPCPLTEREQEMVAAYEAKLKAYERSTTLDLLDSEGQKHMREVWGRAKDDDGRPVLSPIDSHKPQPLVDILVPGAADVERSQGIEF